VNNAINKLNTLYKGDVVGHPFRGNQYTQGESSGNAEADKKDRSAQRFLERNLKPISHQDVVREAIRQHTRGGGNILNYAAGFIGPNGEAYRFGSKEEHDKYLKQLGQKGDLNNLKSDAVNGALLMWRAGDNELNLKSTGNRLTREQQDAMVSLSKEVVKQKGNIYWDLPVGKKHSFKDEAGTAYSYRASESGSSIDSMKNALNTMDRVVSMRIHKK